MTVFNCSCNLPCCACCNPCEPEVWVNGVLVTGGCPTPTPPVTNVPGICACSQCTNSAPTQWKLNVDVVSQPCSGCTVFNGGIILDWAGGCTWQYTDPLNSSNVATLSYNAFTSKWVVELDITGLTGCDCLTNILTYELAAASFNCNGTNTLISTGTITNDCTLDTPGCNYNGNATVTPVQTMTSDQICVSCCDYSIPKTLYMKFGDNSIYNAVLIYTTFASQLGGAGWTTGPLSRVGCAEFYCVSLICNGSSLAMVIQCDAVMGSVCNAGGPIVNPNAIQCHPFSQNYTHPTLGNCLECDQAITIFVQDSAFPMAMSMDQPVKKKSVLFL